MTHNRAQLTQQAGRKTAHARFVDVPTREWTVLAQDPAVRDRSGKALTTHVTAPAELLAPGPKGHRVHVIDYDASNDLYYRARTAAVQDDHYEGVTDIESLVGDPHFHQQNAYAIAMATLGEFEAALGRHVSWGFSSPSHQLKIAPHAFADANAYYSRDSESLNFGYFLGKSGQTVFTCLSHDIVAHETSHALLDGLRSSYLYPSHVDQAAFHEGFADVVASLSVLKSRELLGQSLLGLCRERDLIPAAALTRESLRRNSLLQIAEQFGAELDEVRGRPLRHSLDLDPSQEYLDWDEFQEPHRRGEVFVAAALGSFLTVWERRLDTLGRAQRRPLGRVIVAEEGATAASQLLRILIRTIDYLPPVDMTFPDFLSALLTADQQLYPDDSRYRYREAFIDAFAGFGIHAAANAADGGTWDPPKAGQALRYGGLHFDSLQRDPNAVFRFLWENQRELDLDPEAFTRVTPLRPCTRVSNDGFVLRETVAEYVQTVQLSAGELNQLGILAPKGLSGQTWIRLYGGGTLIFDEFGRLKFHIGTGVKSTRQTERLESLFQQGAFNRDEPRFANFAQLHRRRMLPRMVQTGEEQW